MNAEEFSYQTTAELARLVATSEVTPVELVECAIERIEELAINAARGRSVDLAVHHLGALELANAVAESIQGGLAEDGLVSEVIVSEVGAVVGAHAGPGMIAVVISPRI